MAGFEVTIIYHEADGSYKDSDVLRYAPIENNAAFLPLDLDQAAHWGSGKTIIDSFMDVLMEADFYPRSYRQGNSSGIQAVMLHASGLSARFEAVGRSDLSRYLFEQAVNSSDTYIGFQEGLATQFLCYHRSFFGNR